MAGEPAQGLHPWRVMRQDDNGNRSMVDGCATEEDARRLVARLEARGHRQLYWAERSPESPG